MNEEILNNVWNTLSSDPNAGVKASSFEEWKDSFTQDENIQSNVYNYLKDNHTLKAANQEEWTASVMGKTNGSASATPSVEPIITESGVDVGGLDLPESSDPNDWKGILVDINKGVTKNHSIVKNRLAKEYFNLDQFTAGRRKIGSGMSFQGFVRSEEDDLKSFFG